MSELQATRRVVRIRLAGQWRYIAAEEASRYRDALGVALPPGLPEAFLEPGDDPSAISCRVTPARMAPSRAADAAARFGFGEAACAGAGTMLAAESSRRR